MKKTRLFPHFFTQILTLDLTSTNSLQTLSDLPVTKFISIRRQNFFKIKIYHRKRVKILNRQIQQKSKAIPALRIPSENLKCHCDEQDCSTALNTTSFQLVLIRPINLLLARRMIPFFFALRKQHSTHSLNVLCFRFPVMFLSIKNLISNDVW